LCSSCFRLKFCMNLSCIQYMPHVPAISCFLLNHPDNIWWGIRNIKFFAIQFSYPPKIFLPLSINILLSMQLSKKIDQWFEIKCSPVSQFISRTTLKRIHLPHNPAMIRPNEVVVYFTVHLWYYLTPHNPATILPRNTII
jgi:hypothetical protein